MEFERKYRNHLREWREFRRMTQTQLAEAVDTKGSVISLLESGNRRLSDKWLRRLAPVLKTTAGHLLDHNPEDLPTDVLEIWADIPEERRQQALQVLSTFRQAV
jgi:transcriptional regulator with XRE-family HTH domain